MAKKRVIVIGSGIGGSGVAALLQHSGEFDVSLFEKNHLIGGRFSSYTKDSFRLDIGCHLVANCDKGTLGEILNIVGEPEAVTWCYARKPSPVINFKGERVKFPRDIHKLGFSPEDLNRIMQYYAETNGIGDDQMQSYNTIDMKTQLEKYITSDRARAIFGLLSGILFVIPDEDTPVGEWVFCNRQFMQNRASGYPKGGTGAVPEAYVNILEKRGGRVYRRTAVDRIIVENGTAVGIVTRDGTRHEADLVISNAGVKPTVNQLIGRDAYPSDFLKTVDAYQYSEATLQVKVALDAPVIENESMVMYIGEDDVAAIEKMVAEDIIPESATHAMIPVVSNIDPTAAPEGRQLVFVGGGVRNPAATTSRETWKKWEASYLNALEVVFPGVREHILWTETSTPTDINNMFGEDGCVIGISQKIGQIGADRPALMDPAVNNLYHCSADTGQHGVGGELAADSALRLYRHLLSA